MARSAILIIALLWAFAGTPVAWAECTDELIKLAGSTLTGASYPIPEWSFSTLTLPLQSQDIFPVEFIRQIEKRLGPIQTGTFFSLNGNSVRIHSSVNSQEFFTISFYRNRRHPKKLLIDQLKMENPLDQATESKLKPGQKAKGLPFPIFRHIQRNLFALAKAGGFEEVFTNTQQHFTTAMLYTKIIGMKPSCERSKKLFSELEHIYEFARRELPKRYRPKDVNEFNQWLGTALTWPAGYTNRRRKKLDHYFETGELDSTMRIFKTNDEKPICAVFSDNETADANIVFIYDHFGSPQIVSWATIVKSLELAFSKKL